MSGPVNGVAVGIVTQNKDDLCRVRVKFPWHENPNESFSARLCSPMAGSNRGWVTIPEIGDEVLVAFERSDVRYPYVLGGLWNQKDEPPETNSDGKNNKRVFQSRKKHRIVFNDGDEGSVELIHERGHRVVIDDDGVAFEDEKGSVIKLSSKDGSILIAAVGALKVKSASLVVDGLGEIDRRILSKIACGDPEEHTS